MSAKSVRLYVGFGGSGGKSLLAFAELLASHGEWGDDSETHFAFVLVDTDKRDLKTYSDAIRAVCRRIGKDPIIAEIQTSEGVPVFQTYAADRLQQAGHDQRIQQHWWYNPDSGASNAVPFTAETLYASPEDGAGQCPMVSTFLAWNHLDHMGKEIGAVVEKLQRRLTLADGEQGFPVLCSFIAGLAGGTGRGCWHLLAFKVREVLAELGKQTMPVGYFFDCSVFKEIMAANPGQANKMRINSLTGFSELHGWMRNELHRPDPYNFSLPNIDSPRDETSYLISVKRFISDSKGTVLSGVPGQSPVTQAFVIFGGGKAGDPGSPQHYYKILANAMYARMVNEIASEGINTGQAFGGAGAAAILVPINDLKAYVRSYVSKFLPELYARGQSSAKIEEWCDRLTCLFEAPTPFGYSPNSEGNIFERVIAGVSSNQAQRMKRLEESMDKKKKDYKTTQEECKRIDGWVDSKDGKVAIEAIANRLIIEVLFGAQATKDAKGTGGLLREVGVLDQLTRDEYSAIYGGDPSIEQIGCTTDAFKRMIMAQKLSKTNTDGTTVYLDLQGFGAKAEIATKIATRLKELAKRVPGAPADGSTAGKSASDEFDKARKGFLQSNIDDNEAGIIMTAARSRVRMRCMGIAKPVFEKALNVAADKLDRLAKDLSQVVTLLSEQSEQAEKSCSASRESLFWTSEDFKRVCSQGADQLYHGGILAEQRLEPVANDAALDKALSEAIELGSNDRFQVAQKEFEAKCHAWFAGGDAVGADSNERKRDLRRLLNKSVETLASELVLKQDFYVSSFGFFGVTRSLIQEWGKEFRRRAGSEQDTEKLKSAFRVYFGCDYPFDKDGVVEAKGKDLDAETVRVCQCMAVELASRCDVLFHKKLKAGSTGVGDSASVVLPAQDRFEGDFVKGAIAYGIESGRFPGPGFFKPCVTHKKGAHGNPFTMVAYAQLAFNWKGDQGKGLNEVASLAYYKDPDTAKWLAACEDEKGLSVFAQDPDVLPNADSSYGLGYSSPIFVREKLLRELRWRPWAHQGINVANERMSFVWDAIAFALLDEPPTGEIGRDLLRVTESEGWQVPMIALRSSPSETEGQEKKWQFTRSAFRDNMGVRTANNPACKAGDGFTSIRKLQDALSEGHPNPIVDAIAVEAIQFIRDVLLKHPEEISADGAFTAMFRELRGELQKAKDAETGHTQVEYQALYDQLIARIEVLVKMNAVALLGHFERRGRA